MNSETLLRQFTGKTLDELFPSRGAVENIASVALLNEVTSGLLPAFQER